MAVLKRKLFLPDGELVSFLARVNACKICSPLSDSEWSGMFVLEADSGHRVVVSSDYAGVEFKFEVFYVSPRKDLSSSNWHLQDIISLPRDVQVGLLFQAAWLRPTVEGELPPQYEQVVEEHGNRKLIPANASAAGLYLKGISFKSSGTERVALVLVDDDDPLSLQVITDKQHVSELVRECEYVSPAKLDEWIIDLTAAGWDSASFE